MSLSGYVTSINDQLALLRKDVRELKQENRELKAQLTHAHHKVVGVTRRGNLQHRRPHRRPHLLLQPAGLPQVPLTLFLLFFNLN